MHRNKHKSDEAVIVLFSFVCFLIVVYAKTHWNLTSKMHSDAHTRTHTHTDKDERTCTHVYAHNHISAYESKKKLTKTH